MLPSEFLSELHLFFILSILKSSVSKPRVWFHKGCCRQQLRVAPVWGTTDSGIRALFITVSLSVRFLKMLFFYRQRLLNINFPRLPYSFFPRHTSLKALRLSLQEVFAQENLLKDVSMTLIERARIVGRRPGVPVSLCCGCSWGDRGTQQRKGTAVPLGGPSTVPQQGIQD